MTLLISCWFIIESIVIPDGLFLKWFYLSFYIHPFLLVFCQLFLWLKQLTNWILFLVKYTHFVCLCAFTYFRNFLLFFPLSFKRFSISKVVEKEEEEEEEDQDEDEFFEILQVGYDHQNHQIMVTSYSCYSLQVSTRCELTKIEFQSYDQNEEDSDIYDQEEEEEEEEEEYVSSSVCSSSSSPPGDLDHTNGNYVPSACSFNQHHLIEQDIVVDELSIDSSDPFYDKYTERMRWFDTLNYDRTCGIGAIINKKLGSPSSFERIEPVDFSIPYMPWNKTSRKRLLRSLESDFEMVYVAQTCLSWEALQHQYKKVEATLSFSTTSSQQNGVFYNKSVAFEFQKFRVLLERFMEDERFEGKRYWNYVKGRFSLKSLLQVPKVPGFLDEEKEGMKGEEAKNNAKEVLKSVEKCIKTFWAFVKTDNKNNKPWWKLKNSLWTYSPVEDPRDLELLAQLTKKLQKKELWLKDLQGKKRCWLKRVANNNNGECSQTKEILFTMIEMKLVARVLQMSMISSSQLKWCQEKIDNANFKEGKVIRTCTGLPFFPPS